MSRLRRTAGITPAGQGRTPHHPYFTDPKSNGSRIFLLPFCYVFFLADAPVRGVWVRRSPDYIFAKAMPLRLPPTSKSKDR